MANTLVVKSSTVYSTSQGRHLSEVWQYNNLMVKVEVYRDLYEAQSYARAEVFSPVSLKWNPLTSVPYPLMAATEQSHVSPAKVDPALREDAATLRAQALVILSTL